MAGQTMRRAHVVGYLGDIQATDEQLAALWLKRRIEALSELQVMWSRSAYTARRTTHIAFANGEIKIEGVEPLRHGQLADPLELADLTFSAVRDYRASIEGPAGLVWRCEPEVTTDNGKVRVYCRLCFEPEIAAEALAA
jgi:hypothetical protein